MAFPADRGAPVQLPVLQAFLHGVACDAAKATGKPIRRRARNGGGLETEGWRRRHEAGYASVGCAGWGRRSGVVWRRGWGPFAKKF